MAGMTIELSEYVIDAIADAVVKKMQAPKTDVLDKIRAEIMELQKYKMILGEDKVYIEREEVLQSIDKYKAESEG